VRLYVKRILVADEWNDELLPTYLHFIKGVIDSNDLTLNVDRDRLVKMNSLKAIKRRVTSKLLTVLRSIFQNDPALDGDFYSKFGGNVKYGIVDDEANKKLLSKLLMFYTSYSPKRLTTLDDSVARMKKGQEKIYWIGATTLEEARQSPYAENLLAQGYEVLFALEPIDVHCFERLDEYDGLPLSNPETNDEKTAEKVQDVRGFNITQKLFNRYVRWFKHVIGERMETMVLSTRLKTTPAICTAMHCGYTASHERLLRAQTVHDAKLDENLLMNHKVFEVNFDHPTVKNLLERIKRSQKDKSAIEDARLLYDTALLASGFTMSDTANFTKRVFRMLGRSYGLEADVEEFEAENKVFYPTVEDDFEHAHKFDHRIYLGKSRQGKKEAAQMEQETGDEEPAPLHEPTPEEWYQGLL
jgi:heat shock protein beta